MYSNPDKRRHLSSSSLAPSAGIFSKFSKRNYSVSDLAETPIFPAIFSAGLNLILLSAIVLLLDWSTYILLDSNPLILKDLGVCLGVTFSIFFCCELLKMVFLYFWLRKRGSSTFQRRFRYEILL